MVKSYKKTARKRKAPKAEGGGGEYFPDSKVF